MHIRTDVDKRIIHTGLSEAFLGFSIRISISTVVTIFIVVVTITSTEDIVNTALNILHIGRSFRYFWSICIFRFMNLVQGCRIYTGNEIRFTENLSTQVITAIDVVTNPWEATTVNISKSTIGIHDFLTTYVSLSMS